MFRHGDWTVHDEQGRRKYLSDAERDRLLSVADRGRPLPRLLCRTLLYSGCRVSEALTVLPEHVETDRVALRLRTLKRRKTHFRLVPCPAELIEELLLVRAQPTRPIWTIHRATAHRWISDMMADAGVMGPMACCRGLRHSFGIRAAARGVPGSLIQEWMGHADLSTSSIYIAAVGLEERAFAERMWR